MVPPNNDRQHNKRELERANGNIAWAIQHITTVYDTFYAAGLNLAELEQDIPDSYVETMDGLTQVTKSLLAVAEVVKGINDTI